jgi:diguanylate cyclase (GGDEF)-like protein
MRTNARILVVDDVADNRTIISRTLRRRGFEVIEAENGRAALAEIAANDFDLAFLDICMPQMDGLELLRTIRSGRSASCLPVIMVTARAETDDVMVAFELGASDYVTKPVNLPVLVARAESQLARKRADERLQQALGDIAALNFELRQECARRAEAEARALDLAYHDALTGLYNRIGFGEKLAVALKTGQRGSGPLALLCLDLDGFKPVNDTLGHQAGDELLKAVADRLRGCLRDVDCVGRIGGDEFAILLPSMKGRTDVVAVAERIIEVVSMPFAVEHQEAKVGCSVGIAFACTPEIDPSLLFRSADAALYSAKESGRGTWRIAPDI